MAIRVAINGYGRIGRCVLRALYENKFRDKVEVVAINSVGGTEINAHLTRFDSAHGPFPYEVVTEGHDIVVNDDHIHMLSDRNPRNLPWKDLNVDLVLECTGAFTQKDKALLHVEAGAKKVLISAPGKKVDKTIVYGVNHELLTAEDQVVSNASCTTNCLAPVVKPLQDGLGIESGLMTTIHSYTNDQVLTDVYHKDMRRARSATQSIIPTKTGAAAAIGKVLPELEGRLDGLAVRVPTINVSLVDLTFTASRETSVDEVNNLIKAAAEGPLKGVLECNELPLVSIDFNHNPASSIFDLTQTKVDGNLVKVLAWYDNEWGFSNRMLDTALAMMNA